MSGTNRKYRWLSYRFKEANEREWGFEYANAKGNIGEMSCEEARKHLMLLVNQGGWHPNSMGFLRKSIMDLPAESTREFLDGVTSSRDPHHWQHCLAVRFLKPHVIEVLRAAKKPLHVKEIVHRVECRVGARWLGTEIQRCLESPEISGDLLLSLIRE